jgi:hypothetical protein
MAQSTIEAKAAYSNDHGDKDGQEHLPDSRTQSQPELTHFVIAQGEGSSSRNLLPPAAFR